MASRMSKPSSYQPITDSDTPMEDLVNDMIRKVSITPSEENNVCETVCGGAASERSVAKSTSSLKNVFLYDFYASPSSVDRNETFVIQGWFSGVQKIELRWQCSRCGRMQCPCYGEDSFFSTQSHQSQGDIQVKARFSIDDSTGVGFVWCYSNKVLSHILALSSADWKHLTEAVRKCGGYFANEKMARTRQGEESTVPKVMTYLQAFSVYCSHQCLHREIQLQCTLMHGIKKEHADHAHRPVMKCIAVQT